jgi:hypothetical protein
MTTFFKDKLETTPSSQVLEPTVWIRRLAILESLEKANKPIRELTFRRGLNIVATSVPSTRERRPVGHNVGKTLLTRLIRYCLGETYFASEPTRQAIAKTLPGGYVFAEIVLAGIVWSVARPIGADKSSDAWCMETENWQSLYAATDGYQSYTHFVDLLNDTLASQYSEFELPNADKPASWLNVLAWLSRDQYCRYRNPIEWRSATAGSNNPELSQEDSSLLIRMVMDVLDRSERLLAIEHKRLLDSCSTQSAKLKSMESSLARNREFLKLRLGIDEDLLDDDLFSVAAKEKATEKRNSQSKSLKALQNDEELKRLEAAFSSANESYVRLDQDVLHVEERLRVKQGEKETNESKITSDLTLSLESLGIPCGTPDELCEAKKKMRKPGECNPVIQQRIATIVEEIGELSVKVGRLKGDREKQEARRDAATFELEEYRKKLSIKISDATKALAKTDFLIEEADAHLERLTLVRKQQKKVKGLEAKIEQSRESHAVARGRVASKRNNLNGHFNRVLAALVGDDTQGTIDFDMKGLHLRLADRQAQQGEGLATAELVLSLDLACLSAGICGLGTHPRFLIHDSPREGDLELHIYHRLFEFILELERAFGKREPSFQYIVTTTTPPPKALAIAPYTIATLSSKKPSGLLLRDSF